ncbi:MAG: hypothetical protein ACLQDY_18085 [Streptosporangiaceae bacterium]
MEADGQAFPGQQAKGRNALNYMLDRHVSSMATAADVMNGSIAG